MLTRTVRAESMLEALEQIKNELGPDALIVSARQVPGGPSWQVWKKNMVEVVAVKPETQEAAADEGAGESASQPGSGGPKNKPAKKAAPAALKPRRKPSLPDEEIADLSGGSALQETPPKLKEEPSPVRVREKVRKAVFPELKKEKPALPPQPAPPARQAPAGESGAGRLSPVELMEQMGIISAEAETRPDIDVQAAAPAPIMPPPEEKLEVVQAPVEIQQQVEAPAEKPPLAVEKFSELIAPRLSTRPEEMWPLLAELHLQLKNQGLDEEMLGRITDISLEMVSSRGMNDEKRIRESLSQQLEAHIHIQKENENTRQVICLVGASGSGKTCLCAKLAVKYHSSRQKRVACISADTIRTGAINESRTYADAIGVPLQIAYTPQELYEAVAREKIADVVLVDMPSVNPRSEASVAELGSYLTVLQQRSTWIVAPATAKTSDLVNLAATLAPFKPVAIALTKLDETNTFGSAYNLAWKTQLPLVYYSFGPRVMDELSSARADALVRAMFTERFDG